MIRILGINLVQKKKVYLALTCIYGIGISRSKRILFILDINPMDKVRDLKNNHVLKLHNFFEKMDFKIEKDLKQTISLNIKRLIEIHSYRGKRHLKGLPVRGQRTRTNSRTSRRLNLFKKSK